ncbi:hypothetical protein [Streptomyces erythrochromogenes]|uniref:hypothetical protein n=1 Tax=Streptomyces erythrochromogenes TaxID=285574 RepID=UPI0037D4B4FF
MVAGEVGREEPAEAVSPDRRLRAEVDRAGDKGLADLQPLVPEASAKAAIAARYAASTGPWSLSVSSVPV